MDLEHFESSFDDLLEEGESLSDQTEKERIEREIRATEASIAASKESLKGKIARAHAPLRREINKAIKKQEVYLDELKNQRDIIFKRIKGYERGSPEEDTAKAVLKAIRSGKMPSATPSQAMRGMGPQTVVIPPQSQDTGEMARMGQLVGQNLVNQITTKIHNDLAPKLNKITNALRTSAYQTDATNEHNVILRRDDFRRKVIDELKDLSNELPESHPVRRKINRL
jgi:hypothetical protein